MAITTQLAGGVVGLAIAATYFVADSTLNPEEIHLEIARAEYVEIDGVGHITQQLVSGSGKPIPAVWAAAITRVNDFGVSSVLCSGTGGEERPGIYNGAVDTYNLDDWTGDTCADTRLGPNDFAEATWTYVNEYGLRVTIGVVIKPEQEDE